MEQQNAALDQSNTQELRRSAEASARVINALKPDQWQQAISELEAKIMISYNYAHTVKPRPFYEIFKRTLDFFAAGIALILLSPLYVAIVIAIKRDSPGPVLFRQQRIGRGFKVFSIVKFRTMYRDAADVPVQIYDFAQREYRRPTSLEDPRVTKVGKFLRTWSLDELPQFWNICKGDMSLIGPRPLSLQESFTIPEEAYARYQVPLGLSGLAQLRNRNAALDSDRFADDIEYLRKRSFFYDLRLIFRTFSKLKQS